MPRNRAGRKVPPQLQRMLADDLMAAVFPDAAACLENIPGDRQIPDHPLVSQTVRDLVAGSGLIFEERGSHVLKGVPDEWRLFRAVTS